VIENEYPIDQKQDAPHVCAVPPTNRDGVCGASGLDSDRIADAGLAEQIARVQAEDQIRRDYPGLHAASDFERTLMMALGPGFMAKLKEAKGHMRFCRDVMPGTGGRLKESAEISLDGIDGEVIVCPSVSGFFVRADGPHRTVDFGKSQEAHQRVLMAIAELCAQASLLKENF
jgi:hypothetical protein